MLLNAAKALFNVFTIFLQKSFQSVSKNLPKHFTKKIKASKKHEPK
jgi:hypothetical protein